MQVPTKLSIIFLYVQCTMYTFNILLKLKLLDKKIWEKHFVF